jgi:8-oxo-dGTP diphosphatase
MNPEQLAVAQQYGGRIRLRACGILVENAQVLLVCHRGLNASNCFWAPPGGGVEYTERLSEALMREFREETHLEVSIGSFLLASEYIKPPLHAIEFFFRVEQIGGALSLGTDPEAQLPILTDVGWFSFEAIKALPTHERHGIFERFDSLDALLASSGFYQRGDTQS